MHLPYHATEHLLQDGRQLIDAVERTGFDVAVESCPDWNMGDLAWHIGHVWSFWGHIVSGQLTDLEQIRAETDWPRPDDGVLLDWAAAALTGLYGLLDSTPTDTRIWTWTGSNQDIWWVRRRMALETAVHRWDAERVVGDVYEIPIAMAADGIDEFLHWFAPRGRTSSIGGTAHIHCTDTDRQITTGSDDIAAVTGEWTILRLDENGIDVEPSHVRADAAIRGRAQDVLLWLWGRDGGPVELIGDEDIANRLVAG